MSTRTINAVHNRKTYEFLCNFVGSIALLVGGAGSGKSYSVAQWLLLEHLIGPDPIRILIVRKTLKSLRETVWDLMLQLIDLYDLESMVTVNKSDFTISCGQNVMLFKGLDKVGKLKSIVNIGIIYVEEGTDLTEDDWMQLRLRLRGEGPQIIIATFNPCDYYSFLNKLSTEPLDDGVKVNHSTYLDNQFLSKKYIKTITSAKGVHDHYWTVYGLGLWALLKGLIYTNWTEVASELWPDEDRFDEIFYGLDFGFTHPTVLMKIGLLDGDVYEEELLYETELLNSQIIEKLDILIPDKNRPIYGDGAEPDKIKEIGNDGWNIHNADKGPGSVRLGIDFMKRQTRFIHTDSLNHIKENKNYKYMVTKDGRVLEDPVEYKDDSVDATRYAVYTHCYKRQELKTWSGDFAAKRARDREEPVVHQRWTRGKSIDITAA